MVDFITECVNSWSELNEVLKALEGKWVFRGQTYDWPLTTSLERALKDWEIELRYGPEIERNLVREFRRRYHGEDRNLVAEDTLYCLALMQHYGAPTRLLDWTYSPFVGAQFAIREGKKASILWCINATWCALAAEEVVGKESVALRNVDETRNDTSFVPLFMSSTRKKFVLPENPVKLSQRLIIQQGVFMCPGDIADTFVNNLTKLDGWGSENNVLKVHLTMNRDNLLEAVRQLLSMNVDSATLFPGLEGFARSLKERLPHYKD